MADRRQANAKWLVAEEDGSVLTWERAQLAVLMDLRDELQRLNRTMNCSRVLRMADAMISLNRKVKGKRITARDAARVLAKRRNQK